MYTINWHFVIFFLVTNVLYGIYYVFETQIKERCYRYVLSLFLRALLLFPVSLAMVFLSQWAFSNPAKQEAKALFAGAPIINDDVSLEGKIFKPQAFVVTDKHILVYDEDGKVYALDGITLDGVTPTQLSAGGNVTYTVYKKAGKLLFAKM